MAVVLTAGAVVMLVATLLSAPAPERRVLYDGGSFYPRVIRLEHSGPANGTILAAITTNFGSQGAGVISASTDGGETFQQIAAIEDPAAANGAGICCSFLYELPSPIGAMPAGTVLWAVTVGYQAPEGQRQTRQRLWASSDVGRNWRHVSDIAVSPNQYNTWEPSLAVAADGTLVAFYSDETDKANHDQKLVQVRSADGITWTDYRHTVVNTDWYVRPGMINAIRLPDGSYFMTYEVCNNDLVHLCSAYFRRSADGWDFGDPYDLGTVIRTADGKYGRHTPTVAWSAGPGSAGTVLVITEMLVEDDGSISPGNGKTILANDHVGAGPWYEIPAPIPVEGVNNEGCRNFSPYLLPTPDGKAVLEVTTDYDGPVCKTYYATGPLTPARR
ncbi:sialidase family protein [Kibdelosporangium persicum]|uniref:sialidase family protein n=1 Tax=Kibdelosporangium persicum TaxID=2698649 RepID=UPI001564177B|nr:sialidase family protein [Kibdelosporangium persicum]